MCICCPWNAPGFLLSFIQSFLSSGTFRLYVGQYLTAGAAIVAATATCLTGTAGSAVTAASVTAASVAATQSPVVASVGTDHIAVDVKSDQMTAAAQPIQSSVTNVVDVAKAQPTTTVQTLATYVSVPTVSALPVSVPGV